MEALVERIEPQSCAALRIGEWRVVPDLNQICRGDEAVHLEPKAMAVLLHLANRPGEVASRDELLGAVWPGVIVGDNALTQVVIKLRKALGDTAREPAYIQAISKKGYRLIATVDRLSETPILSQDQPIPPAAIPTRPAVRWLSAALVIAVIGGGAAFLFAQREEKNRAAFRSIESQAELSRTAALPIVIVKPFEPVGAGSRQVMMARAITADLVTDLSKVSGLWVVGGADSDEPPPVASTKRPRYVLSGTVQQEGERLRLNILLAEEGGRQLWSERFDRDVNDLFSVQDDLVRSILAVLPVKLSEAETLRLAQRYTRNLQAYEDFLRGQSALLVRRRSQNEMARELYWKAIQADPTFSRAYAGLAMTYGLEYQLGWAADGESVLSRALEFAKTAVQLSPAMPEAHWVVGFVYTQRRQHDEALRHLESALRLNSSYADAYALMCGIYTFVGRPGEGIPLGRTALRLNPAAGSLYFVVIGRAYYFLGDSEQARVNFEEALRRNSENLEARILLAAAHWQAGERDAAAWQVSEIRVLEPGFSPQAWLATYPMTDAGQKERLMKSLREMGL